MNRKLSLDAPIRSLIIRLLSDDPEYKMILDRLQKHNCLFYGLLEIGCDFYETLELFAVCEAIGQETADCIIKSIPACQSAAFSDKAIRKMIPHWTSSRYHTASIEDICRNLKQKIKSGSDGVFLYNSNLNTKDKKVYNDIYILIIRNKENYFFDINRKKAFQIKKSGQEDIS